MIFKKQLAKLGKANYINLNQVSNNPVTFNVFLNTDGVKQKTLTYENQNYNLSKVLNSFVYTEVIGINSNYVLARIDNYFSIIKVNNES